ncbi:hypothetical protein V6N13_129530 [Hibiscus sabdariffa]|uniref:Uncharacterized protein n=1 Tax=Hibiscus sabdariffa TaxID=183260 RepID=A0ABR2SLQ2_9ROSI
MTRRTQEKRGSSKLGIGRKLYKSSIQKAKEILRIKRMKSGLSDMVESFTEAKKDAAETAARLGSVTVTRNELMGMLNSGIHDLERLRESEALLMLELGWL